VIWHRIVGSLGTLLLGASLCVAVVLIYLFVRNVQHSSFDVVDINTHDILEQDLIEHIQNYRAVLEDATINFEEYRGIRIDANIIMLHGEGQDMVISMEGVIGYQISDNGDARVFIQSDFGEYVHLTEKFSMHGDVVIYPDVDSIGIMDTMDIDTLETNYVITGSNVYYKSADGREVQADYMIYDGDTEEVSFKGNVNTYLGDGAE